MHPLPSLCFAAALLAVAIGLGVAASAIRHTGGGEDSPNESDHWPLA